MDFESLAGVCLVSKLLRQGLDDFCQSVLERFVHLAEVSLRVEAVLHLLHPLGKLVTQMSQLHLKIVYTTNKSIEGLLADTVVVIALRNLQVGEGIGQLTELLLERGDPCLKVFEVFVLERLELGAKSLQLMPQLLTQVIDLGIERLDCLSELLVRVALHL